MRQQAQPELIRDSSDGIFSWYNMQKQYGMEPE